MVSVDVFESQRQRLTRLAYHLTGTLADAEDTVQEAFLRFQKLDAEAIRNVNAWLTTVVTNLALDRLRSAQHQREVYPGTWLPEPQIQERAAEDALISRSNLSLAILFLLEQLTPTERAAFVMREAFEMDYAEIAAVLEKSEAACRQLYSRANARVRKNADQVPQSDPAFRDVVERYADAILREDEAALRAVLAEDAVLFGDGGGKVATNLNPILGADRIVRFLLGLAGKYRCRFSRTSAVINGEPGLLVFFDGAPDQTTSFAIQNGRITHIFNVRNPYKLRRVWECYFSK